MKILVLLLLSRAILNVSASPLSLAAEEDEPSYGQIYAESLDRNEKDIETRQSSNDTDDSFVTSCRIKGVCPEGIASIIAAGTAMGLLGCLACVMWHWEVQGERKARIKMAQSRNRDIDRLAESRKATSLQESIKTTEEEGRMFGVEHEDLGMEMSDASSSDEQRALLKSEERKQPSPRSELPSIHSPTRSEPVNADVEVIQ